MLISLIFVIFLIGSALLSGTSSALERMGKLHAEEVFKAPYTLFFYRHFLRLFFKGRNWDGLFFSLSFTRLLLQLCYALSAFFFLIALEPSPTTLTMNSLRVLMNILIIIAISLASHFAMNLLSLTNPKLFFKITSPLTSCFLTLFSPITIPLFKVLSFFFPPVMRSKLSPSFNLRDKILQMLHDSDLTPYLDPNDQKLILSVASFKERIVREVMVPRIDVFSLASDTPIQEAAQSFLKEGYSRIPVYRESVDKIIGVLHYKDVLTLYAKSVQNKEREELLTTAIEGLVKPVLYTPETKKISNLLQEFRSKQIHLAIVVDEWGGTEGIITIEDILEELVGEIADEYDINEERLFSVLPGGGWIVDGKMSIIDIEEELFIKIPHSPEYDTIGGYIVHRAGAIPSKGWRIHHDEFDLEVLSSDERAIDKIRITPCKIPKSLAKE